MIYGKAVPGVTGYELFRFARYNLLSFVNGQTSRLCRTLKLCGDQPLDSHPLMGGPRQSSSHWYVRFLLLPSASRPYSLPCA